MSVSTVMPPCNAPTWAVKEDFVRLPALSSTVQESPTPSTPVEASTSAGLSHEVDLSSNLSSDSLSDSEFSSYSSD